jgi:hypothetical protein
MVAIWLRGLVLRRRITDRKYRLALRAAATEITKSASRSLRAYTSIHSIISTTLHNEPPPGALPACVLVLAGLSS